MTFATELVTALQQAQHVAVLTGAGIAAASGIPTFREAQTGLWAQYDPQELATPQAFQRNPQLVWKWYAWRRQLIAQASPNAGHLALVQMAARVPRFTLMTQNVDGLHAAAGSEGVIELHGNIWRTKCWQQGHLVDSWPETAALPPRCPHCNSMLRPDVVWFGEGLPQAALTAAARAAQSADVFFSVGTSALVYPAAALPETAAQAGAVTVEVNPAQTPISTAMDFVLAGVADEVLPSLITAVWLPI